MNRHIYTYISVLLSAVLALTSCEKEPALDPSDGDAVTICLSPARMAATRATEYGADPLNENVITGFKLYFYSENSETAAAKYIYPPTGLASATNTGALVDGTNGLTADPSTGEVTLKLSLDKTVAETLFTSDASHCYVYAVANTGDLVTLPSTVGDAATAMGEIKKLPVLAEFGPTKTEDPYAEVQDDFVMDGFATLDRDEDNNITGTVPMYRAAAKITFTVKEVKDVEDRDAEGNLTGTWTAQTGKMFVSYHHLMNYGYINGEPDDSQRAGHYVNFSTSQGRILTAFTNSEGQTNWTHSLPFYSYFDKWSSGSGTDAPYIMLQLPWKYTNAADGSIRYFTCYYAVPFNSLERRIDRNCWYKVSLSVSILGSGDPENPTMITPSYMVLPWGDSPVLTNANLKRYRYLLVDQNDYVMNNVDELAIPFYSSHEVELVSSTMTKTILKPNSGYKPYEETVDASKYSLVPDNSTIPGKSYVNFKHTLVNDYSSDYDVTAYSLTFTFRHKDNEEFTETVTITQYPALYVVASLNSDCSNPDSGTSSRGNYNHYGYIYVNGDQSRSTNWTYARGQGTNTDPYMYVVTISSLPEGSPYIIGDPRTESISVPTMSGSGGYGGPGGGGGSSSRSWANASDMDGTSRQLKYYYPSDTDGSRVNNMVAPSFRIASSYGVAYSYSYADAQKRCASYQEDGYPAGRWRIPTKAEIEYMVMLADDGKIPELLTTESYYWGSNNTAYRPNGATSTENSYIRCVYDEWYWKDKCDKSTFTWGDKQR